ncbi:hypothetical protein THICB3600093 [Thiomonas sp. CB3]|jgi:hypothetical protein|nr:hypothetical protein THICB3600093 [Thiomonas sp. CB3]
MAQIGTGANILFNLVWGSKLRRCGLFALRIRDAYHGGAVASRTSVVHKSMGVPDCESRLG